MKHVMVDIETLGTKPGSVILSIGACRFDERGVGPSEKFDLYYRPVDVFDSLMSGLTVDTATIGWWRMQSLEARGALHPGRPLRETLQDLTKYIVYIEGSSVWAKGPDFDLVLLEAAYDAIGLKKPWRYNAARDVRTMLALAPGVVAALDGQRGVAHRALDDAVFQAECVIAAAEKLGVTLSEMAG